MPETVRVAIVGAGPAGFYAAEALLRQEAPMVSVDMFDRLPTPFGLVRSGVAPDHQKIKSVTRVFERVADHPRFRFFGNVCFGAPLGMEDFRECYHQILFTTGAQADRSLGIPGEKLRGSHSATEFVAWYNGHPDFVDREFDLSAERAVIVGVGNVAIDVARILCRTIDELAATDVADYALEDLRKSRIREVVLLGRRGPAQAAFTLPELKEIGEMQDAEAVTMSDEVELDPLSQSDLEATPDRSTTKIVERLQEYASRGTAGKRKRIVIRFLTSPVEILGDEEGRVAGVRVVRNELVRDGEGRLRPRPVDALEEIPAGLVFRSVGYRGVPLPGVPFREDWGTVPHDRGRVLAEPEGEPATGVYVAGWIKRGPTGVIGTNKADAQETVAAMMEDARAGRLMQPDRPQPEAAEFMLEACPGPIFTYDDWRLLDDYESRTGASSGRPRVKLTGVQEMADMLARLRDKTAR